MVKKSVSLKRKLVTLVMLFGLLGSVFYSVFPVMGEGEGTVYVVINVDSEFWGGHDQYFGTSDPHPVFDMRSYSRTDPMTIAEVFNRLAPE